MTRGGGDPGGPGAEYDLVVLGGGSAGYAAALRAAQLGRSVALVEQDKLGGTCLHRGCIPTKAWLHTAEVTDTAREAAQFGIKASLDGFDPAGAAAYRARVVDALYAGLQGLVTQRRIDLVPGRGEVHSATSVAVDGGRVVRGRHLLLATGSRPASLPGLEPDGRRVLTSDDALTRDDVPQTAVVLGGGVIGVEFASIWNSLGTSVTIVEAQPRLLPDEEEASSAVLARAFRRRGMTLELDCSIEHVKVGDDEVTVTLAGGRTLSAEVLLVAVGRRPTGDDLDLGRIGARVEGGAVVVDELCATTVPTVSAAGDLIATPQLAHVGFAEGLLVADRLTDQAPRPIDYDGVPRVAYCRPEVASVGLTSAAARDAGYEVVTASYDLAANGKSLILRAPGLVTVVAAQDGPVLGVHVVGERASELIAEGQLLVNWDAQPDEVAHLLHPHPTLSEAIGEAHLILAGSPLHMHG